MSAAADPAPKWHPAKKVLFRFLFVYFVLYVFPFPLNVLAWMNKVTELAHRWTFEVWKAVVLAFGEHVLRLDREIDAQLYSNSDTTYGYVQLLIISLASLAGCLVWTLLDRKRDAYPALARWLIVGCRYFLALTLLSYGLGKVIKTQFLAPGLDRLLQPFGEFSPMALLWEFMGVSVSYNVFTGIGELACTALLLFRRTTTLGALLTIGVMSNVAMLNFSYDVPVKVFSTHLLLMACALVAADFRRFANVLVLNRPAPAADLSPHFAAPRANRLRLALKTLLVGFVVYHEITFNLGVWREWGEDRPKPPLYGIYDVESFAVDGETLAPLATDPRYWRTVVHDYPGYVAIWLMNGKRTSYTFVPDESSRTIAVGKRKPPESWTWTYEQPAPGVLKMEGELDGSFISIVMKARDLDDFVLVSRGFHWINERPFYR